MTKEDGVCHPKVKRGGVWSSADGSCMTAVVTEHSTFTTTEDATPRHRLDFKLLSGEVEGVEGVTSAVMMVVRRVDGRIYHSDDTALSRLKLSFKIKPTLDLR